MEKMTPYLIIFVLFPVAILGSILNVCYYTVKGMNSFTDINGAKEGFEKAKSLESEFWLYFKNYTRSLYRKIKLQK